MLGWIAGRPAAIVTFLEGMWMRRPSAVHCAAVGEALAKLHLAGADFPIRRRNALSVDGWRPLYVTAAAGADSVQPACAPRSSASWRTSKAPGPPTCRRA